MTIMGMDGRKIVNALVVALGIVGSLIGIYTGIFYERKPNVGFEVLTKTAVLDVREDVSKLEILYDGINLKNKNQALSVVALKVVNNGQSDLLHSHYDQSDPLGFILVNGVLAESPKIIDASNVYLGAHVQITVKSPQSVAFSPVIIEPKQFFIVKLLVLHERKVVPNIVTTGKIAGTVSKIEVTEPYMEAAEASIWRVSFQGSLLVQLVRSLGYFVTVVAVIIVFAILMIQIDGSRDKFKRKKLVLNFKASYKSPINKKSNDFLDLYINHGEMDVYPLEKLLRASSEDLQLYLSRERSGRTLRGHRIIYRTAQSLYKSGIILRAGRKVVFERNAKTVLAAFYKFWMKDSKVGLSQHISDGDVLELSLSREYDPTPVSRTPS